MKKLLLLLFLIPVFAAAQKTTGGNYTYIAQRYEWLTGIFQALGLPAGDSAQHKPGQDMRAGALYYDTLGIDAGLKIWNGLAWVDIGTGGFFSPDQTSTGNTAHDAGGFNFAINNIGNLGLNSENTNLIANSDFTISGDSVRMNSTSGRITFPNLVADDDTTTFKPMGRDAATGRLRQLSYWPGGGGSGTPAGANTEIQYNNSGSFGASSLFKWDNADTAVNIGNVDIYYTNDNLGALGLELNNVRLGYFSFAPPASANGQGNTFLGYNAGTTNWSSGGTGGLNNTFIGGEAGQNNNSGQQNTFIGSRSGFDNTSGSQNTFVGQGAGNENTTNSNNAYFGYHAGLNATGASNTYIGGSAGQAATGSTASSNTGIGEESLKVVSSGSNNTAVGRFTMGALTTSPANTGVGTNALFTMTTGNGGNSTLGFQSGYELTTGSYNFIGGAYVQAPSTTGVGLMNIGNVLYGTGLYSTASRSSTPTTLGSIGIGLTTPTARLMLPAGTATANTAPLKFTSGTNLTTPENGAVEYDGTHLYVTIAGVRYQLDQQSGSGVTTMGAIGSTPNANGATITGSTLNLEPASATFGGIVTTGTQSFAGTKSFGLISVSGISTSGYYGATETGSISTPGSGIGFFWAKTDGTPNYTNDDGLAVNLVGRKTGTTASAATITPTGDAMQNHYTVTALATNPTFDPPSGTAVDQNTLLIRITDNGTSRTLTWNAIYDEGADIALPTATVISETMYLSFVYNSATSKWQLIGKTGGF